MNIAAFTVTINEDGSISTTLHEENLQRKATMFDVFTACKELVSNIEEQLLADRIANLVAAKLQPKNAADEIKEKIINALNDRKQEAPIE
jgi:hypothetical protein